MGDGWETARRLDRPEILKSLPDNPNILVFYHKTIGLFTNYVIKFFLHHSMFSC